MQLKQGTNIARWLLTMTLCIGFMGLDNRDVAAHDHKVPQAFLEVEGQRQPGYLFQSVWRYPSPKKWKGQTLCATPFSDSISDFPHKVVVLDGSAVATIRLIKKHVPTGLELIEWRKVRRNPHCSSGCHQPAGSPSPLAFSLMPVTRGDEIRAWNVVFPVADVGRHYIQLRAAWPDEEGCHFPPPDLNLDTQYAIWRFFIEVEASLPQHNGPV